METCANIKAFFKASWLGFKKASAIIHSRHEMTIISVCVTLSFCNRDSEARMAQIIFRESLLRLEAKIQWPTNVLRELCKDFRETLMARDYCIP